MLIWTTILRTVEASDPECGITRYAIAVRTGIDQGTLSKFMKGERGLSLAAIDKLMDELGLEISPAKRKVMVIPWPVFSSPQNSRNMSLSTPMKIAAGERRPPTPTSENQNGWQANSKRHAEGPGRAD